MIKYPTGYHFSFVTGNQLYPSQIFLGRFGYYKIFLTEIVKWTKKELIKSARESDES